MQLMIQAGSLRLDVPVKVDVNDLRLENYKNLTSHGKLMLSLGYIGSQNRVTELCYAKFSRAGRMELA